MGVKAETPVIDFSFEDICTRGTTDDIRSRVREACEEHGCFLIRINGNDDMQRLTDELFQGLKSLFDLPDDIKMRYETSTPYGTYKPKGDINVPLLESFGVDEAHLVESSQAFTNLFWPQGNPEFCTALSEMSSIMLQLNLAILKVIFESYGAGHHYESFGGSNVFRLMKYNVPPSGGAMVGLVPHKDSNALTVLCQNDVQGLEIMSKDGVWTEVIVPQGCFPVIVGNTLKAWSNGRMHAVNHRVTMSGDKDRYTCGIFTRPMDEVLVEVPKELVDIEHPILYKPFIYKDYLSYTMSTTRHDALEFFAGV